MIYTEKKEGKDRMIFLSFKHIDLINKETIGYKLLLRQEPAISDKHDIDKLK